MGARLAATRAIYRRWLRLYVPVAALVLGVSTVAGFLLGSAVPVESLPTTEGGGTGPFPALTTVDLAVNNLTALVALSLGAVSLGLVTVLGLVLNGLLIGVVVGIAVQQVDPLVVAMLILPHGVLEIPALLVASAVGLRFGRLTVRYIRGLEERLLTRRDLREAGWLLLCSALLIVVAAYIEANLTLELAERVAGEELVAV
ncbi:stage II sporulation protein M [Haloarcula salinisoli]|uniref:Stage II sporulation protein M n=1 Tax=Haloarcula salinisoli TaxID=2487746 RepID=A0A8J8CA26_9EURY|nr:stage II sporulation protein M [Halomicroarcula salinisoli]MBX0285945.1 stage II sporulation protein M [Halomicroarcula salinisoli]MBX0302563.1 stage II sporulation protein M [Halomicroarcula salinisoli]